MKPRKLTVFRLPTIRSAVEFRRECMEWTRTEMASRLGMRKSHYSDFANGRRRLPYKAMCLAFELGVPPDVLLQTRRTKKEYEDRQSKLLAEEIAARRLGRKP